MLINQRYMELTPISPGTVLSGVTLKTFDVSEKLSQARFKLFIGNTLCIASSDTHIRPDYDTAML